MSETPILVCGLGNVGFRSRSCAKRRPRSRSERGVRVLLRGDAARGGYAVAADDAPLDARQDVLVPISRPLAP